NTLRTLARISTTLIGVVAIAGCTADRPDPTGLKAGAATLSNGLPFTEGGLASPGWQAVIRQYVAQAAFSPQTAARAYPLLGVAQYLAVQRAEAAIGNPNVQDVSAGNGIGAGGRPRLETDRGAVAGASVVVLRYLFSAPAQVQAFEGLVTAQENITRPGPQRAAFLAGEAIGRAVGAEIVTRAIGDGFTNPVTATPPVGPAFWTSNTNPITIAGGSLPGTRAWFLTSASQFRPGPPPAFGSPDFNAAVAEVRQISDTRTQAQIDIAAFWALNAGTETAAGYWLDAASQEIEARGFSEREATHLFALLSATMFDAVIGCWDAKMTYWLIRPWKADLAITTTAAVGKPNHPSYPSGHSCVSSSAGEVLSTAFPEERAHFESLVAEAGRSRVFGGIHYTFDITTGQALGRNVAQFAIAADASGNSVLTDH
ncbi:MAG TPA: vanadium-dependent haloperoxidase, partial [Gemmatimonadaceae bacterium]|nr:vanadium-dependent haloperoxidase [Gemmatimonadaceae bacterium]